MTTTINGRTPEEIRKGLECCCPKWTSGHWVTCRDECPFRNEHAFCKNVLMACTLALLCRLECERDELLQKNQQLECERDEALNDLDTLNYANTELHSAYDAMKRERDALLMETKGFCSSCAFRGKCHARPGMFDNSPPHRLYLGDCEDWQWQGPQEVC